MRKLVVFLPFLLCPSILMAQSKFLKEYVRSFSLRKSDTILIELDIPYEIIDWDRNIVRTFTQLESFSLPDELLKRLARAGRYSMRGDRKNQVLSVFMPEIHHTIEVNGNKLTDEVVAQIYVPHDFPVKVVCNTQTPEEQLNDLWLQQEVLSRRLNYPIHKIINSDNFSDVDFKEGVVVEADEINNTNRFLALKIKVEDKIYNTVSRVGKFFNSSDLMNKEVVFVSHDFRPELRKMPNEGMILLKSEKEDTLSLLKKSDILFFFDE